MDYQVRTRDAMTRRDKAKFSALVAVYIASILYYAIWWFQPQHIPLNWPELGQLGFVLDTILFITLSFVIWRGVALNLFAYWAVSTMKVPVYEPPQPGLKVAVATCFVPGKEPYDVLEKTLKAMKRLKYPHDTWVLDEGDDLVVKAMCRQLGVKHFTRKGVPEYNQASGKFRTRTKNGNLNSWLDKHGNEYDIMAQMDVDFVPEPEFLERTVGYFRDQKVAFVGTPQIHGNKEENWIAKGAAEQVYIFYGPMQQGFFGKGMTNLIGGNHVLRIAAWRDIDGYADSVTEDHVSGMKFYAKGWTSVYVPEPLCIGEVPADMPTYLGQQMRWAYGLTDILIKYTPRLIGNLSWTQKIGYLNLQLFYFFGMAQFLAIVLTSLYLVFGITSAALGFTDWVMHAVPPFLVNIFLFRWLQKFNIDPEVERGFCLKGALLMFATWPMYVVGIVSALLRLKLPYNITRKGSADTDRPALRTYIPHAIGGAISLAGLIVFPLAGFSWPPLVFWASVNLGAMLVVILTMWRPTVPALAPVRFGSLRRTFPTAMATATTAVVLLASINAPEILNIKPYGNLLISTKHVRALKPVEARFLEPDSHPVAIGSVAYSADELEPVSKISHVFVNWQPEQLEDAVYAIHKATVDGKVAMITWQPTFLTIPDMNPDRPERLILQRIVRGDYDSYIEQVATVLKSTEQPLMLRFAHEMDIDDDGIHPWAEQPPELYIAAYQHVHDIFAQKQVDNVRWLWSPSGHWRNGRFVSLDYYPGDRYVDLVGLSVFVYWRWDEWNEERKATHAYRTPEEIIGWSYDQVRSLGKPVVLAEVGVDLHPERRDERKDWMRQMLELVKQDDYSNIVAVVFFNKVQPFNWDADWRLNEEELELVMSTIRTDDHFELAIRQDSKTLASR